MNDYVGICLANGAVADVPFTTKPAIKPDI
jgi:hypothetical protein